MTETKPTPTDAIYALIATKALGKLTIFEERGAIVITGSQADRVRAREVLADQGLTCTRQAVRDEWSC